MIDKLLISALYIEFPYCRKKKKSKNKNFIFF